MGHHLQESSMARFSVSEESLYTLISLLQNQDLKNQENSSALQNKKTIDYRQRVIDATKRQVDLQAEKFREGIKLSAEEVKARTKNSLLRIHNNNLKQNLDEVRQEHARYVFKLQAVIDELGLKLEAEKLREGIKLSAEEVKARTKNSLLRIQDNNLNQNLDEVRQEHARYVFKLQAVIDELGIKLEAEKLREGIKLSAEEVTARTKNSLLRIQNNNLKQNLVEVRQEHARYVFKLQAVIDELGLKLEAEKLREGIKLSAEEVKARTKNFLLRIQNNKLKQNLDEVRQEHARYVFKLQAVIDELGLKLEAKEKEGWEKLKLSAEAQKLIAKELKLKLDGIQFAHVRVVSKAQAKIDELSLELVGKTKQVGDLEARLQADISRIDALILEKLEDSHKLEQAEKTISDLKAESEAMKGEKLESAVEINRVKQELIDDNRRMKVKNESLRMELDAVKSLKNPAVACEATEKSTLLSRTKHDPRKSNCSQAGPVVEDDDWSVVEDDDWGV